jgi:hypothetical protein
LWLFNSQGLALSLFFKASRRRAPINLDDFCVNAAIPAHSNQLMWRGHHEQVRRWKCQSLIPPGVHVLNCVGFHAGATGNCGCGSCAEAPSGCDERCKTKAPMIPSAGVLHKRDVGILICQLEVSQVRWYGYRPAATRNDNVRMSRLFSGRPKPYPMWSLAVSPSKPIVAKVR